MSIPKISLRKQPELFLIEDTPPPLPKTMRITCRVCGAKVEASITWPGLLCEGCAEDPRRTTLHVETVLEGFRTQLNDSVARLNADVAHADETLLNRWNNFRDAVAAGNPSVAKAENVARAGAVGPFADLIRAWLVYQEARAVYEEREAWAKAAFAELQAWTS